MTATLLEILPSPPPFKSGWPWTEESDPLTGIQPDSQAWPLISIVTPSFNQGTFIEETIRSILLQNYPNLEYIIIDGGSTDESIEIIKKYETWLSFWVSEPDLGQSHAINKGFQKSKGKWGNWICSDDMLCKNALNLLAPLLTTRNKVLFFGRGFRINEMSQIIDEVRTSDIKSFSQLTNIKKYWRRGNSIFQPGALFLLEEFKRNHFLNENNHYTMDYELWGKLLVSGNEIIDSQIQVGLFRWYKGQKTSGNKEVTRSLTETAISLIKQNSRLTTFRKFILIFRVWEYRLIYYYHRLRSILGIRRRIKQLIND